MKCLSVFVCFTAFLACVLSCSVEPDLSGESWKSQDANFKKQALLDAIISKAETNGWFNGISTIELAQLFTENMATTMEAEQDTFPCQTILGVIPSERKKLIHSVGTIAPVEFVSTGDHPYTGIFKGASNGFVRLSSAKQPTADPINVAPGIGLKFVRNGVKSGNLVAMYSLEGQTGSFNMFEHDFTNHVPTLKPGDDHALDLLSKKFSTASAWPTMVGLSDLARFDEFGNEESSPVFPFRLVFHPTTHAHRFMSADEGDGDHYYLEKLQGENLGTVWEVYAQAVPENGELQKIGELNQTGDWTASLFGDKDMFFQHQRFDDDLAIHPEWVAPTRAILNHQASVSNYVFEDLPFD